MSTRTDRNQVFAADGTLLSEQVVVVDTTLEVNGATLRQRAIAALAENATFLAMVTPTAAQNAAQVKALTRQVNALIRLAINQLEATD